MIYHVLFVINRHPLIGNNTILGLKSEESYQKKELEGKCNKKNIPKLYASFKFQEAIIFYNDSNNPFRCVVASRDILAGELLLEDFPAVFGPKDQYLGKM